jgi:putative PIG3 family NAD(P)H quinone oxidoreductase
VQAVVIEKFGGPEVLQLREVPEMHPQRGEVRVRVRATAVNRADLLQRAGKYPPPPGCSADIPGLEYAGEVDEIGDDHSALKVGDRVFGLVAGGSYAQHVVVHARTASPIPDHLSFEEAAALPETAITAYDAMVSQGSLKSGEFVLITGGASGVGVIAAQIAHALGAKCIGITRSASKSKRLLEAGYFDKVIVDDGRAYSKEVLRTTSGAGADLVLELVGGHYLQEDLNCIARNGRIILVGLLAGASCEVNLGTLLSKRITVKGTSLRARPIEEKIVVAQLFSKHVVPLLESGAVKPVIDATFPLSEAGKAHSFLESNESFGKVVLVVP